MSWYKEFVLNILSAEPPMEEAQAPHIARIQLSSPRPHDDATLTCVVAGNPAPDIEWFRLENETYHLVTVRSYLFDTLYNIRFKMNNCKAFGFFELAGIFVMYFTS